MKDTSARYQSKSYALKYKDEYTRGLKCKNIRSRIISTREIVILRSILKKIIYHDEKTPLFIDLPCGTGKLGKMLSYYPIKILPADISYEMMSLASKDYSRNKLVGFVRFDAKNMPLRDNSIDTIICLRLFQRIPKKMREIILKEFYRVLKNRLIISYSYYSLFQKFRGKVRKIYDRERPIFFQESLPTIELELVDAGFVPKSKHYVFFGLSSEVIIIAEP